MKSEVLLNDAFKKSAIVHINIIIEFFSFFCEIFHYNSIWSLAHPPFRIQTRMHTIIIIIKLFILCLKYNYGHGNSLKLSKDVTHHTQPQSEL